VHGVEEVDEELVVLGGGQVERLDEGELGHRREEEEGVDERHHRQNLSATLEVAALLARNAIFLLITRASLVLLALKRVISSTGYE
jgi:hypothetical protein